MELDYTQVGDVLLPNLILPRRKNLTLGRYAHMRKNFLKENYKIVYINLLTSCELDEHLSEIEQRANEMEEQLMLKMAAQEGLTEELKANDQMAWVQGMNNLRQRVQEIVLNEVIYTL